MDIEWIEDAAVWKPDALVRDPSRSFAQLLPTYSFEGLAVVRALG
jgi:hypothetical protein